MDMYVYMFVDEFGYIDHVPFLGGGFKDLDIFFLLNVWLAQFFFRLDREKHTN